MSPEIEVKGVDKPVTVVQAVIDQLALMGAVAPISAEQLKEALLVVKDEHSAIAKKYGYDKG